MVEPSSHVSRHTSHVKNGSWDPVKGFPPTTHHSLIFCPTRPPHFWDELGLPFGARKHRAGSQGGLQFRPPAGSSLPGMRRRRLVEPRDPPPVLGRLDDGRWRVDRGRPHPGYFRPQRRSCGLQNTQRVSTRVAAPASLGGGGAGRVPGPVGKALVAVLPDARSGAFVQSASGPPSTTGTGRLRCLAAERN